MEILDQKTRAAVGRLQDLGSEFGAIVTPEGYLADVAMVWATLERAEARERAVQQGIARLLTYLAAWGPDRPPQASALADVAAALVALASPTGPFSTPADPL